MEQLKSSNLKDLENDEGLQYERVKSNLNYVETGESE